MCNPCCGVEGFRMTPVSKGVLGGSTVVGVALLVIGGELLKVSLPAGVGSMVSGAALVPYGVLIAWIARERALPAAPVYEFVGNQQGLFDRCETVFSEDDVPFVYLHVAWKENAAAEPQMCYVRKYEREWQILQERPSERYVDLTPALLHVQENRESRFNLGDREFLVDYEGAHPRISVSRAYHIALPDNEDAERIFSSQNKFPLGAQFQNSKGELINYRYSYLDEVGGVCITTENPEGYNIGRAYWLAEEKLERGGGRRVDVRIGDWKFRAVRLTSGALRIIVLEGVENAM